MRNPVYSINDLNPTNLVPISIINNNIKSIDTGCTGDTTFGFNGAIELSIWDLALIHATERLSKYWEMKMDLIALI